MVAAFSCVALRWVPLDWSPSSSRRGSTSHKALGILGTGIIPSSQLTSSSNGCLQQPWTGVQGPPNADYRPCRHKAIFKFSWSYKNGREGGSKVFPGEHTAWCFQFWSLLSFLPGMLRAQGMCLSHCCLHVSFLWSVLPGVLLGYMSMLNLCRSI